MTPEPEPLMEERIGWAEQVTAGIRSYTQAELQEWCASALATIKAREERIAALEEVICLVDEEQGCCAPGDWCGFKSYGELAVEFAGLGRRATAAEKRIAELQALVDEAVIGATHVAEEIKWRDERIAELEEESRTTTYDEVMDKP